MEDQLLEDAMHLHDTLIRDYLHLEERVLPGLVIEELALESLKDLKKLYDDLENNAYSFYTLMDNDKYRKSATFKLALDSSVEFRQYALEGSARIQKVINERRVPEKVG